MAHDACDFGLFSLDHHLLEEDFGAKQAIMEHVVRILHLANHPAVLMKQKIGSEASV